MDVVNGGFCPACSQCLIGKLLTRANKKFMLYMNIFLQTIRKRPRRVNMGWDTCRTAGFWSIHFRKYILWHLDPGHLVVTGTTATYSLRNLWKNLRVTPARHLSNFGRCHLSLTLATCIPMNILCVSWIWFFFCVSCQYVTSIYTLLIPFRFRPSGAFE